MVKFLFCFSLFAFTICGAASSTIDPIAVKHLAQFLQDFVANFCEDNTIDFCLATKNGILPTFSEELNWRKNELKKEGQLFFVELGNFISENIAKETPQEIGCGICRFSANIFKLFAQKAKELSSQQKELLENRRGLSEGVFYEYQLLYANYDEYAENLCVQSRLPPQKSVVNEFEWALDSSNGGENVGSLKMQELENPLQVKMLAQQMLDFAMTYCKGITQLALCLKVNPFVIGPFQEMFVEMNAKKSELIGKVSFVDQLSTFAKNNAQANAVQFGHAVCQFLANVLAIFFADANGTIARSKMGEAILTKHSLDAKGLGEYKYLALVFCMHRQELEQERGQINNDLRIENPSAKFVWGVSKKTQTTQLSLLKLMPINSTKIKINSSQIMELIKHLKSMDEFDQQWKNSQSSPCVGQIEGMFTHFVKNPSQNAIFAQIVQMGQNTLDISHIVRENEQLKRAILCNFLYAFGTVIVYGATKKANAMDSQQRGTASSSQQQEQFGGGLMELMGPSNVKNTALINNFVEMARRYQEKANSFSGQIIKTLKNQRELFNIIKFNYEHLISTEVVYEWEDGKFPF